MEKDITKLNELNSLGILSDEARERILKRIGDRMKEQVQEKKDDNEKKMTNIIRRIFEQSLSIEDDLGLI